MLPCAEFLVDLAGGIPVDSEYVIFVIDTSGSMSNFAWSTGCEENGSGSRHLPQGQGHPGDERHGGSGGKKISIYVFGDEFTGKSIDEVVNTVDRLNRRDAHGNRTRSSSSTR